MASEPPDVPRRWAWADIDADAITHNVGVIRATVAPSEVWAVVKANGYGHGAVTAARAALRGGAVGLGVALVAEGVELRRAGIDAPILVLSQQAPAEIELGLAAGLALTAYSEPYLDAMVAAADRLGTIGDVHVKIDTGMQRAGADPAAAGALVARVRGEPRLALRGVFTHLAVADEPQRDVTAAQLARFDDVLAALDLPDDVLGDLLIHAANTAGALAHPRSRRSIVRAGIGIYGISPGTGVDHLVHELRPALSLRARVSFVKRVPAGSSISYGHRHTFDRDTVVATVPLGYADGVPRRLSAVGGEVLVGGRRCPIVGVVTMDQLMVDVGADSTVAVGDEVVLIGEQRGPDGPHRIRAEDWAARLDTIGYEVVCAISSRVPRVVRRSIDG